ncbi:hypothetical protein MYRA21_2529 [Myroides sp. A21]|uniref:hypothetical protein n=1 Tax=Myroides sp. A21 TaxID=1583100 RepID=UPI00057EA230|nr:hypothetical protein [Myroides sp. A21]AJA69641.1 hypothetical protein MYRA21_2529 [Myroides sp. A21]
MAYKILYIEDLDGQTRKATLERAYFIIDQIQPSNEVEKIIDDIKNKKPDLLLLDYILTVGSELEYCNAPTIASTWRSLIATKGIEEIPIILMSNEDNIINKYRKDYTSHDLFDYAITKENATKYCTEKFINKCIAFISTYKNIEENKFNLTAILSTEKELIHSKIFFYLNENNKSKYEYSRFIFEHVIRCSGLLIGEDLLSARLGISKESRDWEKLKDLLSDYKYTGVFSEVYNRWWMTKIESWWYSITSERLSLRNFSAEERVQIFKEKLQLDLIQVQSSDKNMSSHYWTICKETKLPLDPFDGIELLEEEFKPWQDKDYISIDGYLQNIDKYSKIVSDLDRKEMRQYS